MGISLWTWKAFERLWKEFVQSAKIVYPNSNQLTWYNREDVLFEGHKDVVLAGIGVGTYTKIASKRRDSERVSQVTLHTRLEHLNFFSQS